MVRSRAAQHCDWRRERRRGNVAYRVFLKFAPPAKRPSLGPCGSAKMDHMAKKPDLAIDSAVGDKSATQAPWMPLIVIVLAQLQMGINVSALPVSLGPISEDLATPATAAATA